MKIMFIFFCCLTAPEYMLCFIGFFVLSAIYAPRHYDYDNEDDNVDDNEDDVVAWPGQGGGWRKRSTKITTSCQLPN